MIISRIIKFQITATPEKIDYFYKNLYELTCKNSTAKKLTYIFAMENTKYSFIEKDGVIIGADIIVPFVFSARTEGMTPDDIWNYEFLKQLVHAVESSGLRFLYSDPIKERKFTIDTSYNFWME